MTTIHWTEATSALQNAQTILVITHARPDGDAIGSLLGLGNALRAMGKDVTCAVELGVPPFVSFLPHSDEVLPALTSGEWDLLITTDMADEQRAGAVGDYAFSHAKTVINIDHHATNSGFGDYQLIMAEAVSAAEVVFDWLDYMVVPITKDIAMPLLTGMVTDTIGFRISSTKTRTLEVAMRLMEYGASLTEITARTLDSRSRQEFELWKRVLPNAVIDGQVIYATVTKQDSDAAGMRDTDDAGLVQYLLSIEDAMVSCIFKERGENLVGLSLRAKQGYNVAEVALAFGGGGHIQAAGATLAGTLADVQAKVLPALQEATRKGQLKLG